METYRSIVRQCRAGRSLAIACLVAFALTGCNPLASSDYAEKFLLTLHARAEYPQNGAPEFDEAPDDPKAIAFITHEDWEATSLSIMEVPALPRQSGSFELLLSAPPTEALLAPPEEHPEWGRAAMGLIVATAKDHPDTVVLTTSHTSDIQGRIEQCSLGICTCSDAGCEVTRRYCERTDAQHCASQTMLCPATNSPDRDCVVSSTEDAALTQAPWSQFSGAAQDYFVLFLEKPDMWDGYWADATNANDGLAAGYHLIQVRFDKRQTPADNICAGDANTPSYAESVAQAQYNDKHGSDLTLAELEALYESPPAGSSVSFAPKYPEYFHLLADASSQCRPDPMLVARAADTEVPITFGPGARFDWFNNL